MVICVWLLLATASSSFPISYCNMDYVFYKSLYLSTLIMLAISYDILCQWSISFRQCISQFSYWFDAFDSRVQLTYLVPKFHNSGACSGMPDQLFFQTDVVVQMAKLQNVVGPRSILWQPARKRWVLDYGETLWMRILGFLI